MSRWQICLASVLFLCLTAAKLLFPVQTEQARQELKQMIEQDDDYLASVQALGRSMADGSLGDELAMAFGFDGFDKTVPAAAEEPVALDDPSEPL